MKEKLKDIFVNNKKFIKNPTTLPLTEHKKKLENKSVAKTCNSFENTFVGNVYNVFNRIEKNDFALMYKKL